MSYQDIAIGRRYQKKSLMPWHLVIKFALFSIVLIGLYYTFLSMKDSIAPVFTVRSVVVSGLDRLKREEIINMSGLGDSANLLTIDLSEIYDRIKKNHWVKDIKIRKELPDTIFIEVAERMPEARVEAKNGIFLVDSEWVVLDKADLAYDLLPLIKGGDHIEISPGKKVELEGAREGLEIIRLLSSHSISKGHNRMTLDLGRRGEIKIDLHDYVLIFKTGSNNEKLDRFLELEEEIRKKFSGPIEIDLRFPKRIIVRQSERGEGEIG